MAISQGWLRQLAPSGWGDGHMPAVSWGDSECRGRGGARGAPTPRGGLKRQRLSSQWKRQGARGARWERAAATGLLRAPTREGRGNKGPQSAATAAAGPSGRGTQWRREPQKANKGKARKRRTDAATLDARWLQQSVIIGPMGWRVNSMSSATKRQPTCSCAKAEEPRTQRH